MIMMAPATILNKPRWDNRRLPTHAADAPSVMKTIERPATNAIEFRKMRATSSAPPPAFSASIDSPESMEIYPGRAGRRRATGKKQTLPGTLLECQAGWLSTFGVVPALLI